MFVFAIIFIALIGLELAYIQLADRFNIIDKPNERSSHTRPTIRGGGVLFAIAWVIYFVMYGWHFPYFTLGMLCLAGISFWDDVKPLSNRVRILVHILAFSLCFYEIGIFDVLPWWGILIAYIVAIGCLNAVNFMDGINGIASVEAITTVVSMAILYYVLNSTLNSDILWLLAACVFGFLLWNTIK